MKRLGRRAMLRGLGGVVVGLPFLEAMAPKASAGDPIIPKRFVCFYTTSGTVQRAWFPTGSGADYELSPILSPLEPYKNDILVLGGISNILGFDSQGAQHQVGIASALSGEKLQPDGPFDDEQGGTVGWGNGISLDRYCAKRIAETTITKVSSLELGVAVTDSNVAARLSYDGPGLPRAPITDPWKVFDTLFADLGTDATALEALRTKRHSVLDAVGTNLDALQKRLGKSDRYKLEAHLEAVREIEKSLDALAACAKPTMPSKPGDIEVNEVYPELLELQTALLVRALACDLTRVATLQCGVDGGGNTIVPTWVDPDIIHNEHSLSHIEDLPENAYRKNQEIAVKTWYAEQFGRLIAGLRDAVELDGTSVLDHTVVLWTNELGDGYLHRFENMPIVLAGSCGGYLKTGRYLSFGSGIDESGSLRSNNDLLLTLCHAMGYEDVSTFGDAGYCTGPIDELT